MCTAYSYEHTMCYVGRLLIYLHSVLNTDCQSQITKYLYIERIKLRPYKGEGHPKTTLYRHRGEEQICLQPTGNLGVSGVWWLASGPDRFIPRRDPVPIVQGLKYIYIYIYVYTYIYDISSGTCNNIRSFSNKCNIRP